MRSIQGVITESFGIDPEASKATVKRLLQNVPMAKEDDFEFLLATSARLRYHDDLDDTRSGQAYLFDEVSVEDLVLIDQIVNDHVLESVVKPGEVLSAENKSGIRGLFDRRVFPLASESDDWISLEGPGFSVKMRHEDGQVMPGTERVEYSDSGDSARLSAFQNRAGLFADLNLSFLSQAFQRSLADGQ